MASILLSARSKFGGRTQKVVPESSRGFRPDIQGLRAFAVVAVILDHLLHWPGGGFVGVDVFFVISGFLITGHLVKTYERTGKISFSDFYKRRVKRILPAAILVIVVTVVASFLLLNQARAKNIAWDGLWAILFGANWRQAAIGTDYFASGEPVSPLQHYWSLAVEEQFYFVWPWVMLALFALTARVSAGRVNLRLIAGVAMTVIIGCSFAWSVWETAQNPAVAYFSTVSRSWELGIGALLAIATPVIVRLPRVIRPLMAWGGLSGLILSLFTIGAATAFPGPGAALPVLSTAMVIAAGTGSSNHRILAPLTNPVAGYIGDISYSLYLWHFPVIILAASFLSEIGLAENLMVAVAIVLVSFFAYELVEDPIRKSGWLSGMPSRKRRDPRPVVSEKYKITALLALATLTAATVLPLLIVTPEANRSVAVVLPAAPTATASAKAPSFGPEVTTIQQQLTAALRMTEWPALEPTMDESLANHSQLPGLNDCGNVDAPSPSECIWGNPDASKTMMLTGDSVGLAWMPTLVKAYGNDWKIMMRAQHGCPFKDGSSPREKCVNHLTDVVSQVQEVKPDLLVVGNNYPDTDAPEGWAKGLSVIMAKVSGATQVVTLASSPHSTDPRKCYKPGSTHTDCVTTVPASYYQLVAAERRAVESTGGKYVDTTSLFCVPDGLCPAFAGATPMKMDDIHVNLWYAEKIAAAFAELLNKSLA